MNKEISDKKLLANILTEVVQGGEVDFSQYTGNENDKPTNAQYHVICIEELFKRLPEYYGFAWDKQALVYNGTYWQSIDDSIMENFLLEFAVSLGVPWLSQKHYRQKESLLRQLASSAPKPQPTADTVINLQNGTLKFKPVPVLMEFDKKDYLRYQLPFSYDKDYQTDLFQSYLDRCLPDKSAQMVLSEFVGYLFVTRETLNLEKFLLLYGSGANGKSVFFDVINALLGSHNITKFSLESLCDDKGYHRAMIENVLLNYCTEVSGNKIQSTNFLKSMASGEPLEARLPYKDPVIISRYAKLIFNVNNLPTTSDMTDGFFRRFLIIPFNEFIQPEERDSRLAQKIISNELSGVLNWVIGGLNRLLINKRFTKCDTMEKAIKQYQIDADTVLAFLSETDTNAGSFLTKGSDLYFNYKEYCCDCGRPAIGRSKFFQRLERQGFERTMKNKQIYFGVKSILQPVISEYKDKFHSEQRF